ncbi:hypothetical protein [Spirosoma sp. KUDC1026]|uniref:hypothetical protein n=1 Tax=Spirosoma sp. KUDC1026 TaxID=2745947 RepID=UPI00159B84D9|nr:hypothetical protein [Spirosoma sp. KUDC1026]QKZ14500.1 hypothetical protein HU175_18455 [Spirosoma sp. KUDC1026]
MGNQNTLPGYMYGQQPLTSPISIKAEPIIRLCYILAGLVPLTLIMRDFLAAKRHDANTVARMHAVWFKAVTLTAVL